MPTSKTYFLVTNYDLSPDGSLKLGSIIADPLEPEEILNQGDVLDIPPANKSSSHKRDWQYTSEVTKDGQFSVWARFVMSLGLGGTVGGGFDTKESNYFSIEDLETTNFTPTPSYIDEAVNKGSVRSYLEGGRYSLPVYMVTGLKIARGTGSFVRRRRTAIREGRAGILTGNLLKFDAGNTNFRQSESEDISFGGGSDFLVAYRLIKITASKTADQSLAAKQEKYGDETAGKFLGVGDEKDTDYGSRSVRVTANMEQDEVFAQEGLGNDTAAAIDEDDNAECQCIVVPSPQ